MLLIELSFIRLLFLFCLDLNTMSLLSSSNAIESHAVQESVGRKLMHIRLYRTTIRNSRCQLRWHQNLFGMSKELWLGFVPGREFFGSLLGSSPICVRIRCSKCSCDPSCEAWRHHPWGMHNIMYYRISPSCLTVLSDGGWSSGGCLCFSPSKFLLRASCLTSGAMMCSRMYVECKLSYSIDYGSDTHS